MMALLRRVSRSFGHRLRLRALHFDTLLRTADSAPARKGRVWLSAGGVKTRRHRVPLKTGGSRANQQMESETNAHNHPPWWSPPSASSATSGVTAVGVVFTALALAAALLRA